MEILLLCALGALATWAIVDIVRDDDDHDDEREPEPEPGTVEAGPGLNLLLETNGSYSGSPHADTFNVKSLDDAPDWRFSGEISTHGGNDTISGSFDAAKISSGAGNDSLDVDLLNSHLDMGIGDDTFEGTADSSDLRGGGGEDWISGIFTDSTLHGGAGDDTFFGQVIGTKVYGGTGEDLLDFEDSHNSTISGGQGNDTINVNGSGLLVWGNEGDDYITAASATETTLSGGLGNDTIHANGERLELNGGDGDDEVHALSAHDSRIYGGTGDDFIALRPDSRGPDTPDLAGTGGNHAYGGDGNDTLRAYVVHDTSVLPDTLTGGAGADSFEVFFQMPFETSPGAQPDLDSGTTDTITEITDFEVGHDKLVLAMGKINGVIPTINLSTLPDGRTSMVELSYLAKSNAAGAGPDPVPHVSTIYVHGDAPLTMNDIEVLPNAPIPEEANA